jgi:putative alpha-1,2-mannosidase
MASEYSFVIPHDMETLIDFMGGPDTFEARLDTMVGTDE